MRTKSDTEVVLASIAHYGWEVLDKCEGMWAFALYDEASGDLTLSRDRFGEKPLYYFLTEEGLYFGSEIKFVAALLGRRLKPMPTISGAISSTATRRYKDSRNGFFEGVREVAIGGNLTCRRGKVASEAPYWTPAIRNRHDAMTYDEAVKGARDRLIRSVELRLRADVPLAFCMSGGVDSNALISIAKRVFGYDVHGFTIMNKDSRYEESDMIEIAVHELGVRHTPIPVATDGFLRACVR